MNDSNGSDLNERASDYFSYHLKEAISELTELLEAIQAGEDIYSDHIRIGLTHSYHHMNWFWNGRKKVKDERVRLTEEELKAYSEFPDDLDSNISRLH